MADRHVNNAVSVYISGRIIGNREQMMKLTDGERAAKGQIRESRKNIVNQTGRSGGLLMWPRLVTSRSFRPIFGAGNPGISPAGGIQSVCTAILSGVVFRSLNGSDDGYDDDSHPTT